MATARSSSPSSPPKKMYMGGHKKVHKAKGGKPFRKRQNKVLLDRLSLPSSSPTLLERIGGTVTTSDLSDMDDLPFSTTPRYYTPEPDEVEQFLESVIRSPAMQACSANNKPALALQTHNLVVDHPPDSPSSVLYSPTQTAVNSALDHCQPLLDDTMSPSAATIEECRARLVPVLAASTQARGAGKRLNSTQCVGLLSDDHCRRLFRQAKEMRRQLSSLVAQKTPVSPWPGSLKRDRQDEVDVWVRHTRHRFDSTNTSDVSRRDGDITLVDANPGLRLPPKAPRAMLQASHPSFHNNAQHQAPYEQVQIASPTSADPSLIDLVHQALTMFPTLVSQTVPDTAANVSAQPTGDQSALAETPTTHPAPSTSADFVSHLPTQPGMWFKQQGHRYAEIVDVDIEVSDEMFYLSTERLPFRLRMHLRLCSVPVSVVMQNNNSDTVNGAIEHHELHWPKKGNLVVQVNPGSERCKTWLPYSLESDPLDVTSCVHPGRNTFRFIQLSDLSEFSFVLVASPPPPEDAWRGWDWASLVERRTSTDDPTDDLSEFAHISVTIRS